jgi:hypothetical protein
MATTSFTPDPRVDAYIDALAAWQGAVRREVRELVHAADPDVEETIIPNNRAGGRRALKAGG